MHTSGAIGAVVLAVLFSSLISCTRPPRIDGSNAQACSSSLAAVTKDAASSKDSSAYTAALAGLMGSFMTEMMGSTFANAFSFTPDPNRRTVRPTLGDSTTISMALCEGLDGYSASDIARKADSLSSKVGDALARRLRAVHLADLQAAKAAYDRVRDSLALFRVESARLLQENDFMGLEATIVLSVRNGTPYTVSRAYFSARAITDGREVPWIEDEFNYQIPGGLAPGETATWRLQPNRFQGAWGEVRVPASARFLVTVKRLNGPGGDPLWGGAEFTLGDQHALDSLLLVKK